MHFYVCTLESRCTWSLSGLGLTCPGQRGMSGPHLTGNWPGESPAGAGSGPALTQSSCVGHGTEGSVRMMSANLYLVWSSMICSCLSIIRFSLSLTSSIFLSMSVTRSDNWKQMYSIFSFLVVTDLVILQLAAPDVSAQSFLVALLFLLLLLLLYLNCNFYA